MRNKCDTKNYFPQAIIISELERFGDWRGIINRAQRPPTRCGFLLRDYNHPDRARLAGEIAAVCRKNNMPFWVGVRTAADLRLAKSLRAHCHFPEAAINLAHKTGASSLNLAAAHNAPAIYRAARAGVGGVLISPVFATTSHPHATPLGVSRFAALANIARAQGLTPIALGGMDAKSARHLSSGAENIVGYAAISSFS